jgi:RNA polymerase sigma factor (sigma-70 family)
MVDLYKHYDRVFGFFKSRGYFKEEARDLTQETFARALRQIGTLRSPDALGSWIRRIAANVWKNELRNRKASKRNGTQLSLSEPTQGVDVDELAALEAKDAPSPLDGLMTAERLAATERCIETLPPAIRQCLQMYAYQGRTYKEISKVLQIPLNTVKTNIHDGRLALRQSVEQLLAGDP